MEVVSYLWMLGLSCFGGWHLAGLTYRAWLVFSIGKSEVKLQDARNALSEIGFNFIDRMAIVRVSPLAKQERENGRL